MSASTTSLSQSLDNLKQVIPSQIIGCTPEVACERVVTCLLSDFISTNTNVADIISQIQSNCPALVSAISQVNASTLQNLTTTENKQALINLVIGAIMSGTTLYTTVQNLKLNVTANTVYNASFLMLVSLILIVLIEKTPGFINLIQDPTCSTVLFNFIDMLQLSYLSLMNSSHLLSDIQQFAIKVGNDALSCCDQCCKCTWNPCQTPSQSIPVPPTMTTSSPSMVQAMKMRKYVEPITFKDAQEQISLRTLSFQTTVQLVNMRHQQVK